MLVFVLHQMLPRRIQKLSVRKIVQRCTFYGNAVIRPLHITTIGKTDKINISSLPEYFVKTYRDINDDAIASFASTIGKSSWDNVVPDDASASYSNFIGIFSSVYDKYKPLIASAILKSVGWNIFRTKVG